MKQSHANPHRPCTSCFFWLRPLSVLFAFPRAGGTFRLFAFLAALLATASAGAMTAEEAADLYFSTNFVSKKYFAKQVSGGFSDKAPEASDICFVVKAGDPTSGNMGVTCGYGQTISFSIPIERYYGTADDIKRLIQNGGLPKTATLRMYVYDVDSAGAPGYAPEKDVLSVNGHEIGDLYGANDQWREDKFEIALSKLKFPSYPGEVVNNEFKIVVDVNNDDWVTQVYWAALEIPAAPPVIISHGIRTSLDEGDLNILEQSIGNLGLPVWVFQYDDNGNNSIREGARQLNSEIETRKSVWHVDSVNLVCHSMGGLKARHYLTDYRKASTSVNAMIQIATPNAGAWLAKAQQIAEDLSEWPGVGSIWGGSVIGSALEWGDFIGPAYEELTPEYMEGYNRDHPIRSYLSDIKMRVLAGTLKWRYWDWDGVVPLSSAHSVIPHYSDSPINDFENIAGHGGLIRGGIARTMSVIQADLLEKKTKSKKYISKSSKSSQQAESSSPLFSQSNNCVAIVAGKQSKATEKTTIAFPVRKGNPTVVTLFVENADNWTVELRNPSGSILSVSDNDVSISVERGIATICLASPLTGTWNVIFDASRSSSSRKSWVMVSQEADSGIELNPELSAESVHVGNSFSVTMRPKVDGVAQTGVSCSVIVQKPDKTSTTYTLRHTGGGVYSASIPTAIEGRYSMVAQATIEGTVYTGNLYGTAHASSATIGADAGSGPVDEDGDGMYDWLVARVGIVGADSSKAYRVLAELVDADGDHIEWASGTAEAGASYAELYFNGAHIFDYGRTSKYVITDVRLFEMGDDWEAQTDARSNWLELDGSSWARYEHELVTIVGAGEDSVVRPEGATMGDLSVGLDVAFDASVSGSFNFSASLRAPDGTLVASAYGTATLSTSLSEGVDVRRVAMTFPGEDIVAAGLEGPWTVTDVLFWNSYHELSPEGEYETSVQTLSSLQSGYDLAFALTGRLVGDWPAAVYLSGTPSEKGSETPVRRSFLVGETIFPHVAFANVGTQAIPATPFNIRFRVEDEFGNVLATWNYNEDHAIGVNAFRYWYQYAWPGIQRLPVGRYTYTVELDTGNAISESDETNNAVSIPFKVVTAIPPDNDDFADAVPLFGAVAAARGSNVNATREDGEPVPAAQKRVSGSAWWSWTAPEDGDYCFSTEGSDFDTVLTVYAGDSWDALEEVDSNDDYPEDVLRTSSLWITDVAAGTTYFVSVAGYAAQSGAIRLSIQPDVGYRSAGESRIQEGADCYHLPFITDDDTPWDGFRISDAFGRDAVRSGSIGDNALSLLATTLSGPGIMTFKWKASCEQKYDTLEFYLDNECVPGTLSGVGGNWRYEAFKVAGSGDHPAFWFYGKDGSDSAGDDCGWLDQVVWVAGSPLTPVYRFYSKSYKGHFFTTDRPERDNLIRSNPNWNYEGAAFFTYETRAAGTVPAYRFYSKSYRAHFYTIDEQEMITIRATNPNWRYEGIAYYVRSTPGLGTTPVYRFWSKAYRHHFFTTDEAEKDGLIATNPNWKYEGIAYYAWATPEEAAGAGVGSTAGARAFGSVKAGVSGFGTDSADEPDACGENALDCPESGTEAGFVADLELAARLNCAGDFHCPVREEWALVALPDGEEIALDGETWLQDASVEARTEVPDEIGPAPSGNIPFADGPVLRLTLPDGTWSATLWSAAAGAFDETDAKGSLLFSVPANGVWHWLRVRDAADEDAADAYSLWLRAE